MIRAALTLWRSFTAGIPVTTLELSTNAIDSKWRRVQARLRAELGKDVSLLVRPVELDRATRNRSCFRPDEIPAQLAAIALSDRLWLAAAPNSPTSPVGVPVRSRMRPRLPNSASDVSPPSSRRPSWALRARGKHLARWPTVGRFRRIALEGAHLLIFHRRLVE